MDEPDLDDLLSEIAGGSQPALTALYDAISSRVHGLTLSLIRNQPRAEQTTHDIFLEIWRRAAAFDRRRGSARTWILTIAHRHAVDRVRATATQQETHDTGPNAEIAHTLPLQRSSPFGGLDLCVEAIALAYFGGLTQQQIATRTDTSISTVKTRMRQGLARLRADPSSFSSTGSSSAAAPSPSLSALHRNPTRRRIPLGADPTSLEGAENDPPTTDLDDISQPNGVGKTPRRATATPVEKEAR